MATWPEHRSELPVASYEPKRVWDQHGSARNSRQLSVSGRPCGDLRASRAQGTLPNLMSGPGEEPGMEQESLSSLPDGLPVACSSITLKTPLPVSGYTCVGDAYDPMTEVEDAVDKAVANIFGITRFCQQSFCFSF